MSTANNPYSDLINVMRQQGAVLNPPAVMLAEVVSEPPELTLKLGDIQIDKDNILIADYLLKDYKRSYRAEGSMHFKASGTLGSTSSNTVPSASVGDHGSHDHGTHKHDVTSLDVTTNKDDFYAEGKEEEEKYLTFTNTLKKGDILAVMPTADRQTFIVICRVVSMQ